MIFDILTIFPHIFDSYVNESMMHRARRRGLINIRFWDIRDYTTDKHKTVDDTPYGGGPGMVLKIEPIFKCLKEAVGEEDMELRIKNYELRITNLKSKVKSQKLKVILLSPKGEQFTQKKAQELAAYDNLVLICGRYEGIDARVEYLVDEQISVGPYVLSGGELGALIVVEAVARLIKGVLGKEESLKVESFSSDLGEVEYPHYTRPEVFEPLHGITWRVPSVLISGNHKQIEAWRKSQMKLCSN